VAGGEIRSPRMSDLYLKQLNVGPMANFCYLIGSKSTKQCYVVDPAWDIASITQAAEKDGMRIAGALVTHYHPDHCGGHLWGHDIQGIAELTGALSVPIYAHKDEVDGICKITGLSRGDISPCSGGDRLSLGGIDITLIHTPGHTPGSQCFLCEGKLVSGDTLFISGCGRVDLPGGNADQLYSSLKTLDKLPPSTILYPGHHYDDVPSASMADVKVRNPYLKAATQSEWRRLRGVD
jgi:hydroxyacylglutathione hydrolase